MVTLAICLRRELAISPLRKLYGDQEETIEGEELAIGTSPFVANRTRAGGPTSTRNANRKVRNNRSVLLKRNLKTKSLEVIKPRLIPRLVGPGITCG